MLKDLILTYLPYILSFNTLYLTYLAGNFKKSAWVFGLCGQIAWLIWMLVAQEYGFLPLNIGMWYMYIRNYIKWK